jgi:nicotinamidase-related amidase
LSSVHRSYELLDRDRSRVICVDLQERLMAAMPDAAAVINSTRLLLQAAELFQVPVAITEQYPQGLGPTVPELAEFATDRPAKTDFSAVNALQIGCVSDAGPAGIADVRDQVVLAGVETHVCLLQTAYDLLSRGYRVYLATDAVASRFASDREMAITRLRDAGVIVTTVEAIAFEWCASASHPQFKALSQLVKNRMPRE